MDALFIKNTYHSRIYAGYVLGPCLIETTNKSTYQIRSYNVRIHKANEVTFLLECKNDPIIERCQKLVFGPCTFEYDWREEDEETAGFNESDNNQWN